MEKFLELSWTKQQPVIEAALACFGRFGYKKASMNDIAQSCGVSKSLLFHYFGSKQQLYGFLAQYAKEVLLEGYRRANIDSEGDLFDRFLAVLSVKLEILQRHPNLTRFIAGMLRETDSAVASFTQFIKAGSQRISYELLQKAGDTDKFKDGVDVKQVMRLIYLMAQGYTNDFFEGSTLPQVMKELQDMLGLLKNNLYKEEHLWGRM